MLHVQVQVITAPMLKATTVQTSKESDSAAGGGRGWRFDVQEGHDTPTEAPIQVVYKTG